MGMRELLALPQESPAKWGAKVDYDARKAVGPKDAVIVHYPGEAGGLQARLLRDGHVACRAKVRGIENYHVNVRGWSGGGYNFVICPHGTLMRMRGAGSAAHNPEDSDNDGRSDNIDGVGVQVLVGNDEQPAPAALQMLQRVHETLGGGLYPHSHTRSTSCPGDHLEAWIKNPTTNAGAAPTWPTTQEENVLSKGSKGDAVAWFQKALKAWNAEALPKYGVDGDYGNEMVDWVRRYQKAADLKQTGQIDGVTAALLASKVGGSSSGLSQSAADKRYVTQVEFDKHRHAEGTTGGPK